MSDLIGPCRIDCAESCEVPDGVTFTECPRPRHAWRDIAACPNEGCGRAFLMQKTATKEPHHA